MNIVKRDRNDLMFPWDSLDGLRKEFERLFSASGSSRGEHPTKGTFSPATDVSETDTEVLVNCNLPGVKAEDVNVSVRDKVITIKGEKKGGQESEGKHYHWKETWEGSYERSFTLPTNVDSTKIEAMLKDGVLTIRLPKTKVSEAKQIPVKS